MSMDPIEERMVMGLRVRVWYDDDSGQDTPRDYDGNLGVLEVWHPRSTLSVGTNDECHDYRPEHKIPCSRCGELDEAREDCGECGGWHERDADPVEWARVEHGARVVLPIYVYEHSGITARTNECEGECGPSGIIFCTPNTLREHGMARAPESKIIESLKAEVEVWAWYLEGRVYGSTIESVDEHGDPDGEVDESCGGFLAESPDECMEQACADAQALADYANGNRESPVSG